ncbi:Xylulose-5-phosphate phosphoketolase [Actinacidiphila cocklensis]|uniref:Xylulose-5-phosphate phosphoketolase n=1 Tax=Actinacidiphila cocklensis TaxID=887465 RepID=A0A9W4GVV8_9ACTN|nr:Xylulose-5-phosphate phosphoketolase [Actinacidiphila cocklensis]
MAGRRTGVVLDGERDPDRLRPCGLGLPLTCTPPRRVRRRTRGRAHDVLDAHMSHPRSAGTPAHTTAVTRLIARYAELVDTGTSPGSANCSPTTPSSPAAVRRCTAGTASRRCCGTP